jgi:adenine deaminase
LGRELTAYVAAGITSTHESVTKRQTLERLRNGMYVYLREGSAWLDIKETIKAYTETGIDPRHICLCTDDKEPESILRDGSVDHCVRRAIEEGVDPLTAIQMATINPAERYRLQYELGSIAPPVPTHATLHSDHNHANPAFARVCQKEGWGAGGPRHPIHTRISRWRPDGQADSEDYELPAPG